MNLSQIKAFQAQFVSVFLETDAEIYNPNLTPLSPFVHLNAAAPATYSLAGSIKCEIGPRLRREAQIQTAGVNDSQGELLITFDQKIVDNGLVTEKSIIKVGADEFNIRFELNRGFTQEPLALVVAEKRSSPCDKT